MLRTTGSHLRGALRREFSAKAGAGGVAGASPRHLSAWKRVLWAFERSPLRLYW